MIEIGGRPILWHIMKLFSNAGFNEFIVCLGYKGYVIKEYFSNYVLHNADLTVDLAKGSVEYRATKHEPWKVTLVDTGAETMTGGRLKRVAKYLTPGRALLPDLWGRGGGCGSEGPGGLSPRAMASRRQSRLCRRRADMAPWRLSTAAFSALSKSPRATMV